jgi:hypothetical protein
MDRFALGFALRLTGPSPDQVVGQADDLVTPA